MEEQFVVLTSTDGSTIGNSIMASMLILIIAIPCALCLNAVLLPTALIFSLSHLINCRAQAPHYGFLYYRCG